MHGDDERAQLNDMAMLRAELPPATSLRPFYEHCGNEYRFSVHAHPASTHNWMEKESRSRLVIFATPSGCKNDEIAFIPLDQLKGLYVGLPLVPNESIEDVVRDVILRPASHAFANLARGFAEFLGGKRQTSSVYEHAHDDTYLLPRMRALAAIETYETPLALSAYISIRNLPDTTMLLGPARLAEVRT